MEKGKNSRESSGPSYEVFLSFRGPDTRYGFTDCLYHGMLAAGILVFRDDESLRVGKRIGGELLQAIEKSKIYIPIFSTNYASSHWCLRELTYMVECTLKSNGDKEILPIFFDVEPVDVKLKTDLYRGTLPKRQKTFCTTEVESWERALIEVGKIKGWNLKKDQGQGDLIQSVIQAVLIKLNIRYRNVTEDLVGVDDRVKAIINMLDMDFDSVRYIVIHGMGGVGKTTLAKVIFNRLSPLFQGCHFLPDVRESAEQHGLVYLQKQLLSKFLDSRSVDQIHVADDGINMIKRVFHSKRVLIVLDDVDEKIHLEKLAEKGNWFGSGSRIIITTRYKSVLTIDGEGSVKSANISTYEVQEMEFHHALKLFSRHAFRRDFPHDDYVSLSEKIVSTLGKLPLALEVTGSSLSGKSKNYWADTLKKLEKAPSREVKKSLMITYERLDDTQRQVFLDIACFFVSEDKTYPFYMWDDCDFFPHAAIEDLCLMSLIKIKDDNTFWMHDQVRDLGRAIVREENFKDPCERSRVWSHQEALSILKQKEGSRKIEALSLRYRREIVTCDEVANLQNLRFLETNGVYLVGDFNNLLSSLRWLSWQWCPHEFAATNLHLTNLVILDLSHSYVSETWIGWDQIKAASRLKVLDLSNCNNLRRTPDLSMLVLLERLTLEGCCNLIEIDPSIGKLKCLTILNLNGCESLQELPKEIGCLEALTDILMPCLPHEFKLPETFGNLKSLLTFDLSHRQITKLPDSIGEMVKLRRLNLSGCTKIRELPDSVGELQSLVALDLSSTNLGHLPDSIGNLEQLKVLRMSRMRRITKLPGAISLLEKLEELYADYCCNLTGEIPQGIGRLSCLKILDLSCTRISCLPNTLSYLSSLATLNLESCNGLRQLPELPPSLTCLKWTQDTVEFFEGKWYSDRNVTALRTTISPLAQLEKLALSSQFMNFHPWPPSNLRELEVGNLRIGSPSMFSNLTNLSTLRLDSCLMSAFFGRLLSKVRPRPPKVSRRKLPPSKDPCLESCVLSTFSGWVPSEDPCQPSKDPRLDSCVMSTFSGWVPSEDPCQPSKDPCPPSKDPCLDSCVLSTFSGWVPSEDPCLDSCVLSTFSGWVPSEDPCQPSKDPCPPSKDPWRLSEDLEWLSKYHVGRESDVLGGLFRSHKSFYLKMERLRCLELHRCGFLSRVLDLSWLKDLQEVHLLGCSLLVEILGLEELGSFCFLSVVDCSSVERISDLSNLGKLRKLRLGNCPKLRSVEGLYLLESLQKLWIHDCSSLESLADTSNLHLECSTIERCERLPNRASYCRCHDNTDSVLTELDHIKYF